MKNLLIVSIFFCFAQPTLARPFIDVTWAMLAVIPEDEVALRTELSELIIAAEFLATTIPHDWERHFSPAALIFMRKMLYKAPEGRSLELWQKLSLSVQSYFPGPDNLNTWQKTALEIFLGLLDFEDFLSKKKGA
jgi:hypothetical protein